MISADILTLTSHLPSRHLAADEVVYREGESLTTVLVLVEGQLEVERGGVVINRHGVPGSVVGEVSALLQQPRAGTVTAIVPSVIREIHAPDDFFAANPAVAVEVARQLAGRLYRLTAYVTDVQRQFADHEGHLGVFGELLTRIAERPPVKIEPGSDRSPDY